MQGAIHQQVFDVLKSTFQGPWLEGFASPFNVCLSTFCSAYPDLDWHFGSMGNFMEYSFRQGGCCEANPPFSPAIMEGMIDHMEKELELADENDTSLVFVIVVPTGDSDGAAAAKQAAMVSFERMTSSQYCRKHIRLAAREHGYLEGAQHLRPTQYRQSAYDTSVIILQSQKARVEKHDMKVLTKSIRTAFASRHEKELKDRRRKDK